MRADPASAATTPARPDGAALAAGAGMPDSAKRTPVAATTPNAAEADGALAPGNELATPVEPATPAGLAIPMEPAAPAVLEIRQLAFSYGEDPLIHGLDLTVHAGELMALVGDNGSGKSTLMALITGQLTPARGTIQLFGDDAAANRHYADIAYVSQDSIRGYRSFPTTIGELVGIHLRHLKASADVSELLETVELTGLARRRLSELSGGQLQRVGLLLALIKDARLILLDEPTSAIDRRFSAAFYRILQSLARSGTAIVVITHHLTDAHGATMRVVRLEDGRCHEEHGESAMPQGSRSAGVGRVDGREA